MFVGFYKGYIVLVVYILMIVYYIGWIMMYRNIRSVVYKCFKNVEKIIIFFFYWFYYYYLVVVMVDYYYVVRWYCGNIMIYDKFDWVLFLDNNIMWVVK